MPETQEIIPLQEGINVNVLLAKIPSELLQREMQIRTQKEVQILMNQLTDYKSQNDKKQIELSEKVDSIENALINHYQATSFIKQRVHSEDYVNRTNLGKNFRLKISPQRMAKLLKYTGIFLSYANEPAQDCYKGVEPLCIREKFVTDSGYEDYKVHFHQVRTWEKITNRLRKDELLDDFTNCKTVNELNDFIDGL